MWMPDAVREFNPSVRLIGVLMGLFGCVGGIIGWLTYSEIDD